ncbi:MAG: nitrophenyl compound nitroreductase subunit ArsF family protein [Bacteroidales bacterium]|nr:nitrophenyl compound nitroreductase subunit ArsF family protein [Bacteroidales bacterium]
MKKLLLFLTAILTMASCGNAQNNNATKAKAPAATGAKATINTKPVAQKEYVEVLYFHGKQRCITCNAIEKLTREVIEGSFAEQVKSGKLVFKVIDFSKEENAKIAEKYEVTFSSLFLNTWKNGKESRNNLTKFGFGYAKNTPDLFKSGIKKQLEDLLK